MYGGNCGKEVGEVSKVCRLWPLVDNEFCEFARIFFLFAWDFDADGSLWGPVKGETYRYTGEQQTRLIRGWEHQITIFAIHMALF